MTKYDSYKIYHEALKKTNFTSLSTLIFNITTLNKKYNNEVSNISSSDWEDNVNAVLKIKLSYSTNAMQALSNDISVNVQSIIDNGTKLLEILEQMSQKQTIIDTLTKTVSEFNRDKNNAYNKLKTFQDKNTEKYNEAYSKYSSLLNKYNDKKWELDTCKNQMDELGIEADKLIDKLKSINFTANIFGMLEGTVVASDSSITDTIPVSTSESLEPSEEVIHILETESTEESIDITKNESNGSTETLDNQLIEKLGIRVDKNGQPIMKGNAYVAYLNGMGYLVHIPHDLNGNIKSNLPVMLEFHGSGEANNSSTRTKAKELPGDRMGLYQVNQNPETPAIMVIPVSSNKAWLTSDLKKANDITKNVVSSLNANADNIIVYGHSAGGVGALQYTATYPEGVKLTVSIDGRPTNEVAKKLSDKAVLYINSESTGPKKGGSSYFEITEKIMKSVNPNCIKETVKISDYKNNPNAPENLQSKQEVEKILADIINNKENALVHTKGSSHVTVRDFTTKTVDFYDLILSLI